MTKYVELKLRNSYLKEEGEVLILFQAMLLIKRGLVNHFLTLPPWQGMVGLVERLPKIEHTWLP